MPSTYTTSLRITQQADGENSSTWGQIQNTNHTLFEQAIAGVLSKSVAGSSDVTLTASNGSSDESRNAIYQFTGVLTGNINVIVPTVPRSFVVYNNTTGSYTLTVKTASGSGVAVPQTGKLPLYCDGVNVVAGLAQTTLSLSGALSAGTVSSSGALTVLSGGATISGNSSITGTLTTSSALTVSAGGITATGTSTFNNNVSVTSGGLELGSTSTVTSPYVDFHSSGNNIDYDCRIVGSGGSGSVGQGTLTYRAASHAVVGPMSVSGIATLSNSVVVSSGGGSIAGGLTITGGSFFSRGITDQATSQTLVVDSSQRVLVGTASPATGYTAAGDLTVTGAVSSKTTARAFVMFNGSTMAAGDSWNVTSVAKNGTGDYTVNFSNAMPDSNYAVCIDRGNTTTVYGYVSAFQARTTTTFRFQALRDGSGTLFDCDKISVVVYA